MKRLVSVMAVLFISMLATPKLWSQGKPGHKNMDGWGRNSGYCKMYTNEKAIKVSGEIIEISKFTPQKGASYGMELTLKTGDGERIVHLGPGWYMEKQEMQLKVGDKVEVEGAEVDFNDRQVIMAAEIERGEQKLKLRDGDGMPVWR